MESKEKNVLSLINKFNLETSNLESEYNAALTKLKKEYVGKKEQFIKEGEKLSKYYEFGARDFADVICDLLSLYNGESFTYRLESKNLFIKSQNRNYFIFDVRYRGDETSYIKMDYFSKGYQNESPKFILDSTFVSLFEYKYIKEFIEIVVDYKIKNNKENISLEELKQLEFEFVKERADEIREIHKEIYIKEEKELKKNLEIKQRDMENYLGGILNK